MLVFLEFWSWMCHSSVCTQSMETPAPLPAVRSGTSLLPNPLLHERWQACHQAEQSGLGEAGKRVQATEQLLLVPVTITVLLRDFSICLRRWSLRRGYSWLDTAGGSIVLGEEGKRTGGIRNQFCGGYQAELSSLCLHYPVAIHFPELCPGWMLVMLCSPPPCMYSGAKSEFLKCVLWFYFCSPPPHLPRKWVVTQVMKTPFNLCETPENLKDGNLVLGPSGAVEVLLLKAVLR